MTESAVPRRSLNRDPRFLRLWAAETISHFGSSITGIALPCVAITLLNAGPLEVAILNLADFLPFLLIGLLAGALVDRLPRRAVLIGSDLRRLGTCVRLSRQCRRTLQVNVIIGLGWTLAIVVFAAFGWLGAAGAMIAAVLHNLSTLMVLGNAGRLLRFQEPLSKLED